MASKIVIDPFGIDEPRALFFWLVGQSPSHDGSQKLSILVMVVIAQTHHFEHRGLAQNSAYLYKDATAHYL